MPEQWKEANVMTIYKRNGQGCDPGNNRPVSLTSQVGKLFERIMRDYLVKFLEENKLLRDSQHGFRTRRSCLTNLLEFLDLVSDYVDEGIPVGAVYLDFQKAFDKVSNSKLLFKMARYGIDNKNNNNNNNNNKTIYSAVSWPKPKARALYIVTIIKLNDEAIESGLVIINYVQYNSWNRCVFRRRLKVSTDSDCLT